MMTPLDIQTVKFSNSPMGYKKSEVDSFVAQILTDYEKLYKDAAESSEKIKSLTKLVDSYKSMEDTMKNTLVVAQQSAEQLTKAAKKESDTILGEANQKSKEIISKATSKLDEVNADYEKVKKEFKNFIITAKAELEVQIKNFEGIQEELK